MEQEVTRQQPINVVERDGVRYTILGTAHVSQASADAVREMLGSGEYDAVAIELCENRHNALQNPDAWQKMDLFKIIREKKAGLVAANLALGAYQQRIAEQFGIEPGAEMRAALEEAKKSDLEVLLIDRDVGVTLRRVYRSVRFWERWSIMGGLVAGLVSSEEVSEEEIELLKEGDMLESTFSEFASRSEAMYNALISERDSYMGAVLRSNAENHDHKNVLVVIGAGHMAGLTAHLESDQEEPSALAKRLNESPPKAKWPKLIPWVISLLVIAGFAWGFSREQSLGWSLVQTWVLINGTLSALGALIAGAHPLTTVTAFVAAPITSLNPTIGAGMATAAVELWLRKPRVSDFQALRSDVTHARGWWRNRVARTFLVFFFSTLGSAIGTWVAGFQIVEKLT